MIGANQTDTNIHSKTCHRLFVLLVVVVVVSHSWSRHAVCLNGDVPVVLWMQDNGSQEYTSQCLDSIRALYPPASPSSHAFLALMCPASGVEERRTRGDPLCLLLSAEPFAIFTPPSLSLFSLPVYLTLFRVQYMLLILWPKYMFIASSSGQKWIHTHTHTHTSKHFDPLLSVFCVLRQTLFSLPLMSLTACVCE